MNDRSPAPGCVPFVPAIADPPEVSAAAIRGFDWFYAAAIATWLACGLWPLAAIARGQFSGTPAATYLVAFLAYGGALLALLMLPQRRTHLPLAVPVMLAAIETLTAIFMMADTSIHLRGTGVGVGLLVIIAAELPYFLAGRMIWSWIVVQTVAMVWFIGGITNGGAVENLTFSIAALGFQVFAAASSILAISEGRARTNLARTNAELTATRELLAESSRMSERLRISRDLHDTLGHHLTALSLQLDVAARLSDGKAAEHIQQAHAITRLLLSDVRDVVSTLRETSKLNLAEAIRALTVQPAGAWIHLDVPETLVVEDPERAEAILRAVQEVLTNAARHASATNLWIRLETSADAITLHARDDGRGADAVNRGNGLRGMRERYEQYGGSVDVQSSPGAGFMIRAFMPLARSA